MRYTWIQLADEDPSIFLSIRLDGFHCVQKSSAILITTSQASKRDFIAYKLHSGSELNLGVSLFLFPACWSFPTCNAFSLALRIMPAYALHSWVVGLALLSESIPRHNIGQAMGYVGLAMSLGLLIAPLLGGVVFDRAGYDAVFAMTYGLIDMDIALRVVLIEKKVVARWEKCTEGCLQVPEQDPRTSKTTGAYDSGTEEEDIADILSLYATRPDLAPRLRLPRRESPAVHTTRTLQSLPLGLQTKHVASRSNSVGSDPISDPYFPFQTFLSLPTFHPFPIYHSTASHRDSHEPEPSFAHRLPPLVTLLKSRRLLAALWGSLAQAALLTAFDSVLTVHAAQTFHWNSTAAGLLFFPLVTPSFFGPLVGYMTDRVGARVPTTVGFLLACPPFICLRFVVRDRVGDKVLLCALLFLIGITLTLVFAPFMAEISGIVVAEEKKQRERRETSNSSYAQAFGLYNMAFAGGCLIGPLLAGFVGMGGHGLGDGDTERRFSRADVSVDGGMDRRRAD